MEQESSPLDPEPVDVKRNNEERMETEERPENPDEKRKEKSGTSKDLAEENKNVAVDPSKFDLNMKFCKKYVKILLPLQEIILHY